MRATGDETLWVDGDDDDDNPWNVSDIGPWTTAIVLGRNNDISSVAYDDDTLKLSSFKQVAQVPVSIELILSSTIE